MHDLFQVLHQHSACSRLAAATDGSPPQRAPNPSSREQGCRQQENAGLDPA
jgi:hypothetical protein